MEVLINPAYNDEKPKAPNIKIDRFSSII